MKVETLDITTIKRGVIVHQANCQGVMGAGLAKAIRDKWPTVYDDYLLNLLEAPHAVLELGKIYAVNPSPSIWVFTVMGQFDYQRRGQPKQRHTDYGALCEAFRKLSNEMRNVGLPFYVPYKMGCGLGGGDWREVRRIIKHFTPKAILFKPEVHNG